MNPEEGIEKQAPVIKYATMSLQRTFIEWLNEKTEDLEAFSRHLDWIARERRERRKRRRYRIDRFIDDWPTAITE